MAVPGMMSVTLICDTLPNRGSACRCRGRGRGSFTLEEAFTGRRRSEQRFPNGLKTDEQEAMIDWLESNGRENGPSTTG